MKLYLLSMGAGVLVGLIYSLINVRSPAPPLIALLGLLGMLGGEQVIPVAKRLLSGTTLSVAWRDAHCASHVFGMLPGRHASQQARRETADTEENRS
ncbi:XapX domain-containing protein [Paraburkholderia dipogonis]|uniref:XapX domain-containing protein n=2 Tax=Paraburkholderia TaxID=1822464 RepID=A0ABW9B7F3_9BURK